MSFAVALASTFLMAQATTTAVPVPIAVRLEARVTECPSAVEVQAALAQVVGNGKPSPAGWVLSYDRDPTVTDTSRDASLWMTVTDPSGARFVERRIPASPEDCPALAGAMAAVVERSLRMLGWTRGEPLPASAQTPGAPATPRASGPDGEAPARRRPPRLVLGLGPSLATADRAGTNLRLDARVCLAGPVCVRLGGGLFSGSASQSLGAGTARSTSRYFTLAPLAVLTSWRVEWALGPGLLLDYEHGSGDLAQDGSGDRATVALGLTTAVAVRLSARWRLGLDLEGFRAVAGPDFFVELDGKRTVVLAPPRWQGMAALQLEFLPWP